MSTTKAVRNAIVARLATINGAAGGYTYALDGTDQVRSGKYSRPPGAASAPFACVWTVGVEESSGPPLPDKSQLGTFMVLAWVRASAKHPSARQDAAEDILDDIRAALRADPRLGGLVIEMRASGAPFEDERDQTPDQATWGVCAVSVAATWRER